MALEAIFFGSIGTLAETSDIQRRAYNAAMEESGLNWSWDRETYVELLTIVGGQDRLRMLAQATQTDLNDEAITAIHRRKTEIAGEMLREKPLALRPGVLELVSYANRNRLLTGLVTSTSIENIEAIFEATDGDLDRAAFDVIISRDMVESGKPSSEPYRCALESLGVSAANVVAIEDTESSVLSAKRAGITTIATPGAFATTQNFEDAELVCDALANETGQLNPAFFRLLALKDAHVKDMSAAPSAL